MASTHTRNVSARRRMARSRRHFRVRKKVVGTTARPRLVVTRSARHIYAQLVDDSRGVTIASASTFKLTDGDKKAKAGEVGASIAQQAKSAGIEKIVFDRGGSDYHGRVAALADAAREGGLTF